MRREPIISIRAMFNRARELAKIPGVIPHDLRRSTIRDLGNKWGVPRGAVMQATGIAQIPSMNNMPS